MAKVIGSYLISRTLKEEGVDTLFYLMGGPNFDIVMAAEDLGIRCIDFRHEQAAAFAAHAYARVTGKPGVCTAASGPGTLNLLTGVYTAAIDCAPMVILGGAGPVHDIGREAFQEVDQVGVMEPMMKWVHQTTHGGTVSGGREHGFSGRRPPAGPGRSTSTAAPTSCTRRSRRRTRSSPTAPSGEAGRPRRRRSSSKRRSTCSSGVRASDDLLGRRRVLLRSVR